MMDRRAALVIIGSLTTAGTCTYAGVRPVRPDLYDCEGCDAVFEKPPVAFEALSMIAAPEEPGERLVLSGFVLKPDGTRPAEGVIVYLQQTNAAGLYANGSQVSERSRRHGRLRGWAKTGADGRFTFLKIKPGPYPDRTLPAHIHLFVGEPGRRPYYVDDVVFDGEFGVTPAYRSAQELRGGSGFVRLQSSEDGTLLAVRNIILERHPGQ
jgi:protocatechuate 3,4-dioxygenase, beta subunit